MDYRVSGEQMKAIDRYTIQKIGIPSLVLMERAALSVAQVVEECWGKHQGKVAIICGTGNNGADGVAAGRILHLHHLDVTIYYVGSLSKATDEMKQQLRIGKKIGLNIQFNAKPDLTAYPIVVDALLGVGLSREVKDPYLQWISAIDPEKHEIIAVDVPSGLSATSGEVLGKAVKADYTVTFGLMKMGLEKGDAKQYTGKVKVMDIGYPDFVVDQVIQSKM